TGAIRRVGGERLPRIRMEFGLPRGVLARGADGGRRGHRRQPRLVGYRGEDRALRRRRCPRAARIHQAFFTVSTPLTLRPFRAAGCRPGRGASDQLEALPARGPGSPVGVGGGGGDRPVVDRPWCDGVLSQLWRGGITLRRSP